MQKILNYRWLIATILMIGQASVSEATEQVRLTRADGSELISYVDLPKGDYLFPLVFVIDGVPCRSVLPTHESIMSNAVDLNVGLITLEKQGITGVDAIDQKEYNRTYCREARIADYLQYVGEIRKGLFSGWSGEIVLVGGSEGGMLIGDILEHIPETTALVILASGGGIPIRQEMHWAIHHYLESLWLPQFAVDDMMKTVEKQFDMMIANPTDQLTFGEFTYKWWASHLQSDKLLDKLFTCELPIFYAHGTADFVVPFHSTEILVRELLKKGKKNLYFRPVENYGHDLLAPPENIGKEAFEWLQYHLSRCEMKPPVSNVEPDVVVEVVEENHDREDVRDNVDEQINDPEVEVEEVRDSEDANESDNSENDNTENDNTEEDEYTRFIGPPRHR